MATSFAVRAVWISNSILQQIEVNRTCKSLAPFFGTLARRCAPVRPRLPAAMVSAARKPDGWQGTVLPPALTKPSLCLGGLDTPAASIPAAGLFQGTKGIPDAGTDGTHSIQAPFTIVGGELQSMQAEYTDACWLNAQGRALGRSAILAREARYPST